MSMWKLFFLYFFEETVRTSGIFSETIELLGSLEEMQQISSVP